MAKQPKETPPLENSILNLLKALDACDPDSDKATAVAKNVKLLAESRPLPEPTEKSWWRENSGAILTTVGGLIGVVVIVGAESVGDRILTTKSFPFVPKPNSR